MFYTEIKLNLKKSVFSDTSKMPSSRMKVNRLFGGKYRFHLQGRRISWARNQGENRAGPISICALGSVCSVISAPRTGYELVSILVRVALT
jgi:hypothetical protein